MSRTDEVLARHELELQNAALEDELVALKSSGDNPERLRVVKQELRELRRFWRDVREAVGGDVADGDAVVSPAVVEVATEVKEV